MKLKPELRAHVDDERRLVLPTEIVSRYGLKPDTEVYINDTALTHCQTGRGGYHLISY